MGLENLQSVFNDLSENTNSSITGRHGGFSHLEDHSSFDDIEKNLISDPNPRVGMLRGILTEGNVFVFELPQPPDKKPLTGRDISDYNDDILKYSTIDPNFTQDPERGIYSPISDKSQDFNSFLYLPFPKIDSVFANKSIRLRGGESLIDTEIEHTFGFTIYDDLIKQSIPIKKDPDSQLGIQDENITFKSFLDGSEIGPQPGFSGNFLTDQNNPTYSSEDKKQQRDGYLFQTLGENNQLGVGKFVFGSLYEHDHSGFANREDIEIRPHNAGNWWESSPNGVAGTVKLTRTGIGSSANLNIKEYSNGFRTGASFLGFGDGREPYIVNEIPDDAGVIQIGNDRDLVPFTQTLQDMSRLTKYYSSTEGRLWFIGKDFLYGAAFASTPLPTRFGEYSGGPHKVIEGHNTTEFTPYYALNTDRLLSHIMVPPIPTPNTGLLSLAGLTLDAKKMGFQSLRKPGIKFTYSELIKQTTGTPTTVSKIEQLQGGKALLDKHAGLPYSDPDKEYSKRTVRTSTDSTQQSNLHLRADQDLLPISLKPPTRGPQGYGHQYPTQVTLEKEYSERTLFNSTDPKYQSNLHFTGSILTSGHYTRNIFRTSGNKKLAFPPNIRTIGHPEHDIESQTNASWTGHANYPFKTLSSLGKIESFPVSKEEGKTELGTLNLPFMKLTGTPDMDYIPGFPNDISNQTKLNQRDDKIANSLSVLQSTDFAPTDFYVKFKDLRTSQVIYFRGYVTGITENITPSYSTTNYSGRAESIHRYMSTERDLSFNLRLYPNNNKELTRMYGKIEYLTSLCYPGYSDDNDGILRMSPPFAELYMGHIGTPDNGQFGFVKSISYAVDETGDWDVDFKIPRLIDVAISYQMLSNNRKAPHLGFADETKFENNRRTTLNSWEEHFIPKVSGLGGDSTLFKQGI